MRFRPPAVASDRRLLGELKIITANIVRPAIEKILMHLGLQPQPALEAPAREPVPPYAA